MVFEYSNYRTFLKNELAQRVSTNPSYSLRAFARALEVAPSMLSEVLKSKKNLSRESAQEISERLGLTEKQAEYFIALVDYDSAKSEPLKEKVRARMESLNPQRVSHDLSLEVFKAIANWQHISALATFEMALPPTDGAELARYLGISKAEAEAALDRLFELELVERRRDGRIRKAKGNLLAKSVKPNAALRRFHHQMLAKAQEALEGQSNLEKFVGSETLAIDARLLKEAEEIFEDCFARIIRLSERSKKKDAVYHMGLQFFRVAKGQKS